MLQFIFGKQDCQNIRKSLRQEWIETNGLGDYSSSTLIGCNTRKYHGLFTVDFAKPEGRHILLSALEESFIIGGHEFFFSCRRHPQVYYPHGHEYLQLVEVSPWVKHHYRFGDIRMHRDIMMISGKHLLLIRYKILLGSSSSLKMPLVLRIKPLLAFRNMHSLTFENNTLNPATSPAVSGFSVRPYEALPTMFMQTTGSFGFRPNPDWCRNVEYIVEAERGFPNREDLFMPGVMDIDLPPNKEIFIAVSTEQIDNPALELKALWEKEAARRTAGEIDSYGVVSRTLQQGSLIEHLSREAKRFIVRDSEGLPSVVAGYPWFGAWGRDTCISLPGLTFCTGRNLAGKDILLRLGQSVRNGLIPNMFGPNGHNAYNSVDASLWYVWAVQMMDSTIPAESADVLKEQLWPVIKEIIRAYSSGTVDQVWQDEEGFLHVGDASTQLTWMDANVNGKPVTSRHGCPVEINALWYNALAYARKLARRYNESGWDCAEKLNNMRRVFYERFWIEKKRYLADTWRPEGRDESLRPNQIFAVSLPYAILDEDYRPFVVEKVRNTLLTPFGLRTLAPEDSRYCHEYAGDSVQRDSAYHQGTVWPWLLGAYTDALLKTAWDVNGAVSHLLEQIEPLFSEHLYEGGVGSISEIFDGDPPHISNGCIAQSWSVAEALRMLLALQKAAPSVYNKWEEKVLHGLETTISVLGSPAVFRVEGILNQGGQF